jgi:arylsulfatase A-like enzyme
VVSLGVLPFHITLAESQRPNFVVILADDLGYTDLGVYGSTFYETPNLDRLAREGARFTDAYAACPVCSPTRASLFTGQYPQRIGITDYLGAPAPEKWNRNTRLRPAPYTDRLPLGTPTLARALKQGGYATFFAGKWHLGPEGWWPENHGFDFNLGGHGRGGPYGGKQYFSPYDNPRLPDGPEGEHLPDRLAAETARFIANHRNQPFLAVLSFYSVHTPLMAREDLRQKYDAKREQLGLEPRWGREHERDVRLVQDHAVYAGMVEAMDLAVGKVLAQLDALELRDRTVVMFTSDNGGLSTSEGWPTSNVPLRAGKGWPYEGGIRVPFLLRFPGLAAPRSTLQTPIITADILPTILELARILPTFPIDGLSLVPLCRGQSLPDRPLFWHYPHYGNQGGAPNAVIRRQDWKLIEWLEDSRLELFNLALDPGEQTNLADREPQRVSQLRAELHAWQNNVGARFPSPNPGFDPAKPSGRAASRITPRSHPRRGRRRDGARHAYRAAQAGSRSPGACG